MDHVDCRTVSNQNVCDSRSGKKIIVSFSMAISDKNVLLQKRLDTNLFSFLGELTPSQFPVFTIYVQKNCMASASVCDAAWSFERVMDHAMESNAITRAQRDSRSECMELCLNDDSCR